MPRTHRSGRLAAWLEERAGLRTLWRRVADEPIPGGARWLYVPGSALAVAVLLQLVTGLLLATSYSASATDAWASVWYIEHQMTAGRVIRGLHHFGASAAIALMGLHIAQTFVQGAYRRPRELNWILGVVLMFLMLAFGLTGYLLPWDQKGYWATQVATRLVGTTPVVGPALQALAQGGDQYGNLTLTRFYALHALVLPAALCTLLVAHVALFRKHGVTTSPPAPRAEAHRIEPFIPHQLLRDIVASAALVGLLLALAVRYGAPLDAPADPASDYEARPEWYFLFLFQLLKYFEGPLVLLGTQVIPGLGAAFLLLVPLLDRVRGGRLRDRWRVGLPLALMATAIVALACLAVVEDADDPHLQASRAKAAKEAEQAIADAAESGIHTSGLPTVTLARGAWKANGCGSCHRKDGAGGGYGPDLTGFSSRAYIRRFLEKPHDRWMFGPSLYECVCAGLTPCDPAESQDRPLCDPGRCESVAAEPCAHPVPSPFDLGPMPAFSVLAKDLPPPEREAALDAVIERVWAEREPPDVDAARAARGEAYLRSLTCDGCHRLLPPERDAAHGTDEDEAAPPVWRAPSLQGYGGIDWFEAQLRRPHARERFDKGNRMTIYKGLAPNDVQLLWTWLMRTP